MRKHSLALLLCVAAAGCGDDTSSSSDLRVGGDMSVAPDLVQLGTTYKYVSNTITLPAMKTDFAFDLNGDGKADNKLGDIVNTLKAVGVDLQMEEATSVAGGSGLELFGLTTQDPTLTNDATATVSLLVALPQPNPDFTGAGQFFPDTSAAKGTLPGPLAASTFTSPDPKTETTPPTVWLAIPVYTNTIVNLPLVGARITFQPSTNGLAMGQLNGAVQQMDIQTRLLPALATTLTKLENLSPCDQSCMTAKNYDTNKDGTVTVAELMNNVVVSALLAPDVQLFDSMGNWKPDASNANPDSLSLGVQFTAVKANFAD